MMFAMWWWIPTLAVCVRPGSQYLASRPEVNVNAWTNARIEPSSILAFAHAFTLTSGRDARYCEPGLSIPALMVLLW